MRTFKLKLLLMALMASAVFISCNKEDKEKVNGAYSNGIFIVNEGPFQNGTGTITYYNPDSNLVKQDIFELENSRPLGNIAQSMTVVNGMGYIVINNAGVVEVVDINTFKSKGAITNFKNPSQFLAIDSKKAYVSDWAGNVAIVNISSNTIAGTIPAGTGPDAMIKSGNYVFVINSGGLGMDSTVTVIDFTKDQVVKTIQVGHAPSGIVADGNGKIWVMCKGKGFAGWPTANDTPGLLARIDPVSLAVDFKYTFSSTGDHPEKLVINKQKTMLYFLYNYGIYQFNTAVSNSSPVKFVSRSFYSLGFENKTGYLYASDPKDFTNKGYVFRMNSTNGSVVDSIPAGIIPRGFVFPE